MHSVYIILQVLSNSVHLDSHGVETTRRFLLEWLSFFHRYIPFGILERAPQKMNERPPKYIGRDEMETLLASSNSNDWVKIRFVKEEDGLYIYIGFANDRSFLILILFQ